MKRTPAAGAVYRVSDMARLLGLDRKGPRRVEGWIEQDFIKPAVRGKGPGRSRRFSFEHLFLGKLLLEVQAAFGEKSPLVGKLLPTVEKHVREYWLGKSEGKLAHSFYSHLASHEDLGSHEEGVFLAVTQEAGKVVETALVSAGDLGTYMLRQKQATAVTMFNLSALHRSLRERLSE